MLFLDVHAMAKGKGTGTAGPRGDANARPTRQPTRDANQRSGRTNEALTAMNANRDANGRRRSGRVAGRFAGGRR